MEFISRTPCVLPIKLDKETDLCELRGLTMTHKQLLSHVYLSPPEMLLQCCTCDADTRERVFFVLNIIFSQHLFQPDVNDLILFFFKGETL